MNLALLGETLVTLLVIIDPLGAVPVFVSLTKSMTAPERHRAAWQAVALGFGVIAVFAVAGRSLLAYLHVQVPALQAAGGLLLILVALELLTGKTDDPNRAVTSNVALVPLGTPLVAGPGAIVATMLFVQRAHGFLDLVALALALTLVMGVLYLTLRFSGLLVRLLRPAGVEVMSRIAGLLLAAVAVQLIADGVATFVRSYAGA